MSAPGAAVGSREAELLRRARTGDESAFAELADGFRPELQLHCYRIVGSVQDAEDLVQETLLAAWRGLERFEGRASVRSWLYRIATNRCLNALRDRGHREGCQNWDSSPNWVLTPFKQEPSTSACEMCYLRARASRNQSDPASA
jgi:RNA polymerase sigma factor (sigma-70 family)